MANQSSKTNTKKPKLVRDSFTIPKAEFMAIDGMKTRAIALGISVKKSELLRAGLKLLQSLSDSAYKAAIAAVPTLKTGRPATETPPATQPLKAALKRVVRKTSPAPVSQATVKIVAKAGVKTAVKNASKPVAKPAAKRIEKPAAKTVIQAATPARALKPAVTRKVTVKTAATQAIAPKAVPAKKPATRRAAQPKAAPPKNKA